MSSSAATAPTTVAPAAPRTTLGENRGIKFNIKTGNNTWSCTVQDRTHYERVKAAREALSSETSSTSSKSD